VNLGMFIVTLQDTFSSTLNILGKSLGVQLWQACEMKAKHGDLLSMFSAKFTPEVVNQRTAMIEAWDLDSSKPNPYEESEKSV